MKTYLAVLMSVFALVSVFGMVSAVPAPPASCAAGGACTPGSVCCFTDSSGSHGVTCGNGGTWGQDFPCPANKVCSAEGVGGRCVKSGSTASTAAAHNALVMALGGNTNAKLLFP